MGRTLEIDLEKVGPPTDGSSKASSPAVPREQLKTVRFHKNIPPLTTINDLVDSKSRKSVRDRERSTRASRAEGRKSTRRQTSNRGGQQQKDVVQNFFRHLLHQGSPGDSQRSSRSARASRTGGTGKHKEALRALETLASKQSKDRRS